MLLQCRQISLLMAYIRRVELLDKCNETTLFIIQDLDLHLAHKYCSFLLKISWSVSSRCSSVRSLASVSQFFSEIPTRQIPVRKGSEENFGMQQTLDFKHSHIQDDYYTRFITLSRATLGVCVCVCVWVWVCGWVWVGG